MEVISFDPKNFFLALLVFIGGCMGFEPSGPVKVEAPASVESPALTVSNSFLIELKEDNTVWCHIPGDTKQASQKVNEPIRKNLGKLIADYKKQYNGRSTNFLVKGHPKSKYTVFENVIDALRDNNEYKYELVTDEVSKTDHPAGDALDLNMPKPSVENSKSKYE